MRKLFFGVFVCVLVAVPAMPDVYDLSADWSDAVNPNGVWSYQINGEPGFSSWRGGDYFDPPQPIWTDSAGSFVGWSKNNGGTAPWVTWDLQTGDIYGHTPYSGSLEIQWTSPLSGLIDVSGAVWAIRDFERWNNWALSLNETTLATGIVGSGDAYSRLNPALISILNLDVNTGDVLEFRAWVVDGGTPDYIALDLSISPVPVPAAVLLGILGLGVAGWKLRRFA